MKKCKICEATIPQKRTYCSNKCKFSDTEYNKSRASKTENQKEIQIKCKHCGKQFGDQLNKSGVATRHLRDEHGIVNADYKDHFTFERIELPETWNCPLCDWTTPDMKNASGCITNHIKRQHNIDIVEFNQNYPEHKVQSKSARLATRFKEANQYVECKICGEKMSIISNSHCKNRHGITQREYKAKYGDLITSADMSERLRPLGGSNGVYVSKGETEIRDYLSEIGIETWTSYKIGGIEIDIYEPKQKIGIEYNGLYWHSELNGRDKGYHLHKTEYCESKGIRLIHIFEDEWQGNSDLIKARLAHLFGVSNAERVYARNCQIQAITAKQKSAFLKTYHLQGDDKSSIRYGAFYDGKLVAVATFSKRRVALGSKSTSGEYELNRFAIHTDYIIVGILSKMIERFKRDHNPRSIITYADRRYSSLDNIYEKVGFKFVQKTRPNYFYMYRYGKRLHRYGFTKHRIVEMGGQPELTEWENMLKLGYDRIWDCGHLKYEMTI